LATTKSTEKKTKAPVKAAVKKPAVKAQPKKKDAKARKEEIKDQILGKLERYFGKTLEEASNKQIYKAVAMTVRDLIMDKWTQTESYRNKIGSKKLYYLSFEFLIGRMLGNNIMSLGEQKIFEEILEEMGMDLNTIEEMESDAGLGNGGLGRLAACFMNSLATLDYPAYGCGIRYEFGLFKQKIVDGYQIEMPDPWLEDGCAWEIERPEEQVEVHFGGHVESYFENGDMKFFVRDATTVLAVPYDVPVVGYDTNTVNTLRLWSARSPKRIDFSLFSHGDYTKAAEEKVLAESLSKILYPEDNHLGGKILRLRQQYFFTSATLQWILKDFKKMNKPLVEIPDYIQIHVNDTHPAIAIPEMMRLLMDVEGLGWDTAWDITTKTFAYTNHTVMAEALEKWPVSIMKEQVPRIFMIIDEINRRLVNQLVEKYGDDWGKINYMSVIAHDYVSMANLCIVGGHSVNGVSALHTEILKNDNFRDYYSLTPEKFVNMTNGITHRRWLLRANPELTKLITEAIGDDFIKNPQKLQNLKPFAKDAAFKEKFAKIKYDNKVKFSNFMLNEFGTKIDPTSIFDTQAKRLHEYKRQLLNILHVQYLYNQLLENPNMDIEPQTFFFAAKAAPGYHRAKLIIKLINSISEEINRNKEIASKLKVVFLENYGVSIAEKLIPATEVSEQISTAGKEASGTGNMKFMMNGALTVGTMDGANVEMFERVGDENIYIFGLRENEVSKIYSTGNTISPEVYTNNYRLRKVMDQLVDGTIVADKPNVFNELHHALLQGDSGFPDPYMVLADFESYCDIHDRISKDYRDKDKWYEKAILNVAASGYFSSDRTIEEYNAKIWKLR